MTDEKAVSWVSPIWSGLSEEERIRIVEKIGNPPVRYERGACLWQAGERVTGVGIVLAGEVSILVEDLEGRRNILAKLGAGDLLGEVFAISQKPSAVTAYTEVGAKVLFLDIERLYGESWDAVPFLQKFHRNFLNLLANKTEQLNVKIQCMGQRGIREKVSHYLFYQYRVAGTNPFTIPLNREELADYLCVDRSALSYVLSQMAHDGMIRYKRNRFTLTHPCNLPRQ